MDKNHIAVLQKVNENIRTFSDMFSKQIDTLKRSIEVSKSLSADLGKIVNNALKQLPNDLDILAHHGWYPSMYFSPRETYDLARMLEKGYVIKVEKFMDDYYTKFIKDIKESLCIRFPARRKPISSGIRAHKRRDYYAAIPIFLAQAEGICVELTGIKLYSSKKGIPKVSEFINQLPSSNYSSIFLHPLLSQGLITANENIRARFPGTINRHEILHGSSIEYGTRGNSLRALSWLNYIGEALYDSTKNPYKQS